MVLFAEEEAVRLGASAVAPEHLLLGLLHDPSNVALRILARLGVDVSALRSKVEGRLTARAQGADKEIRLTRESKRVIDLAYEEPKPRRLNADWLGTEHLLLGLLRGGGQVVTEAFRLQGVSEETCRSTLETFYKEQVV
jgi:ATP-dependent Clp protease ATP-binding subunit ClpA